MRSHVEHRPQNSVINVQLTDGELHVSASLEFDEAGQLAADLIEAAPDYIQREVREAFDG